MMISKENDVTFSDPGAVPKVAADGSLVRRDTTAAAARGVEKMSKHVVCLDDLDFNILSSGASVCPGKSFGQLTSHILTDSLSDMH